MNYNKDFAVINTSTNVKEALDTMLQSGVRLLVIESEGKPVGICDSLHLLMQKDQPEQKLVYHSDFIMGADQELLSQFKDNFSYALLVNSTGNIMGWTDQKSIEIEYVKQMYSKDLRAITTDLEAIVESVYDEVLVVDSYGKIIRVSNRSTHHLWGVNPETVIGENILELEEKGWFKPSVTRKVMEEKKKISIVQHNRFGRKILAVGNPIFNQKNELERIVIASRDITAVKKLEEELEEAKSLKEKYRKEVDILKKVQQGNDKRIIYQSEQIKNLMFEVERVARVESTVTLYGESGVGKELFAQAIHQLSPRVEKPFIRINCGSIPENLLESELFGYEKGAFTGALNNGKKGLFELANEGTLFLDEIGELPLNLQVKLLRAIQEREIMKIGGSKAIPINIRIITATNKNLEEMVTKGTFREDLFYRIHVIPLFIPPLRERIEDIEPIVYHFLDYYNERFSSKKYFSEDAMEVLKIYKWPGNIRQLQNVTERAMVVTAEQMITANDLVKILDNRQKNQHPVEVHTIIPLQHAVQDTERQLLQLALLKYKTLTKVAEVLEVSQPTISRLYNKLKNSLQVR
ncbi:sigma 54-interacting transcriptional regulator [Neobacillus niacini]|uniref:sigma-54 interaction domain-containing protein n=1 Tax=Neobacillus niacini TaxID=86668 RepID=UPI00285DA46D|nr:sigma 54-interacting transcriptional regulator [Neobacillus niacini]MDR7001204.1 PAS domain S-box-containing protein [Neobacillus niacini]